MNEPQATIRRIARMLPGWLVTWSALPGRPPWEVVAVAPLPVVGCYRWGEGKGWTWEGGAKPLDVGPPTMARTIQEGAQEAARPSALV